MSQLLFVSEDMSPSLVLCQHGEGFLTHQRSKRMKHLGQTLEIKMIRIKFEFYFLSITICNHFLAR